MTESQWLALILSEYQVYKRFRAADWDRKPEHLFAVLDKLEEARRDPRATIADDERRFRENAAIRERLISGCGGA